MQTIRHNVFETNSSSTHSITFPNSATPTSRINGLSVSLGRYGWEFETLTSPGEKASYFYTLFNERPGSSPYVPTTTCGKSIYKAWNEVVKKYNFNLLKPKDDDEFYYVDHGDDHLSEMLTKNNRLGTAEGLAQFIASDECVIFLGNDNSAEPPNFRNSVAELQSMRATIHIGELDTGYKIKSHPDSASLTKALEDLAHYIAETKDYTSKGYWRAEAIDIDAKSVAFNLYSWGKDDILDSYELPLTITGRYVL